MNRIMTIALLATCLSFSMSAYAGPAVRSNPKGDGDPQAMTCRPAREIGGSLHIPHYGPTVCATNRVWADLVKNNKTVDANGNVVPAWASATIIGPASSTEMGPPAYYVGSQ